MSQTEIKKCTECGGECITYKNPNTKVDRTYCKKCGFGLNEIKKEFHYTGDPHQDPETGIWYCSECPESFETEKEWMEHWAKFHDEGE